MADGLEILNDSRSGRFWASVGRSVYRLAGLGEPFCRGWRWMPAAVAAGTVPLLASLALRQGGHQLVSAVMLALLCLACVRDGTWIKGHAVIALAFVAHSMLVITVAYVQPAAVAPLLPDADDYWQKQIAWIETGSDPEYELAAWVPAHVQLLAAVVFLSFTSFGVIPFYEGFYEVDLMNFYNAQLIARSSNQTLALMTGWHVWSLLRGIGYLFVIYEVIAFSFEFFSGVTIATKKARRLRWAVGLAFILADGVVKATLLESVRAQLFSNLK